MKLKHLQSSIFIERLEIVRLNMSQASLASPQQKGLPHAEPFETQSTAPRNSNEPSASKETQASKSHHLDRLWTNPTNSSSTPSSQSSRQKTSASTSTTEDQTSRSWCSSSLANCRLGTTQRRAPGGRCTRGEEAQGGYSLKSYGRWRKMTGFRSRASSGCQLTCSRLVWGIWWIGQLGWSRRGCDCMMGVVGKDEAIQG